MALTLTSTSFLPTITPHSRLGVKKPRFTVLAKTPFSGFQLRKTKVEPTSSDDDTSNKIGPFNFNLSFGKASDVNSLIPVVNNPFQGLSFVNGRRKDPATVFVAGATGQAGIRIVQTLLREGFSVRAGVPDLGQAQELARLAVQYKIISKEESKRFNAVESSFQNAESIAKAIGNASKVVVTIGPSENGPTSEVSPSDASQVIQAAQLAEVGHVALIYDVNNATASPSTYNVLDGISLFFNGLFSRSQQLTVTELLRELIETEVKYTFIKTSLTDDFSPESKYNVVVSAEGNDGSYDYKVAKSQIASLVANVFANTAVAENKVVEVSTNPSAPLRSADELFSAIPEDGRRKAYVEALAKAKAEEVAKIAAEKALEAAETAQKLEKEVKKLSVEEARSASLAQEAQQKSEAAGTSVESLLSKANEISSGFSWEKVSSQIATAVQKTNGKPQVQIATVRGQAKARSLTPNKAVVRQSTPKLKLPSFKQEKPKPKGKETESKAEVRKVFGGLFQQETIYVDD
ncbi:protein PLASTID TRANSCRIPTIONALLY ACTIVE 16, chloroplastic-like [Tripterygium wilfordii]|uniref:protein PLASTID TRANSCRIPTIONALLY ACTIVE 16, chloroplastic-like n=1 Tax=Tripterygium wilfordii TaxID=458696 RepID=UPI0018F808D1|nr:protein PLASTID TRANSCRIPTIONALLY ACTIVE 16, chloroplastic-like [Tripterygium wilfordii]